MSISVSDKDKNDFKVAGIAGVLCYVFLSGASNVLVGTEGAKQKASVDAEHNTVALFNTLYRQQIPTLNGQKLSELKSLKDNNARAFVTCVDGQIQQAPVLSLQDGKIQAPAINLPVDADKVARCMSAEFSKKASDEIAGSRNAGVATLGLVALVGGMIGMVYLLPAGYRLSRQVASEAATYVRTKISSRPSPS